MDMLIILLATSFILLLAVIFLLVIASKEKPEKLPPYHNIEDSRTPETDIQKIRKQILAK